MGVIVRRAVPDDVDQLYELIQGYAESGILLPRSREVLHRLIEEFVVAEDEGNVIGCGSLCQLGQDLVEVRSLGLRKDYIGKGIGKRVVALLIEEAQRRGIPKIMALTYEVAFFESMGFHVVDKEIFPEKVWTDCVHCPKQNCCDEIAVLRRLS